MHQTTQLDLFIEIILKMMVEIDSRNKWEVLLLLSRRREFVDVARIVKTFTIDR